MLRGFNIYIKVSFYPIIYNYFFPSYEVVHHDTPSAAATLPPPPSSLLKFKTCL